jgi:hypothetical protein
MYLLPNKKRRWQKRLNIKNEEEFMSGKYPVSELNNTLRRLDFYHDCLKRDIEDIILGKENHEEAAGCLDDLSWELEELVVDIRNLAHRLRGESAQKVMQK